MRYLNIAKVQFLKVIAIVMAVMISCKTPTATTGDNHAKSVNVLSQSNWQLYSMNGKIVNATDGSQIPSVAFDMQNMTAGGNSGCNSFSGGFVAGKESLSFGNLAGTRMMCQDMKLETEFLSTVPNVRTYHLAEGRLVLSDAGGKQLMVFDPVSK